MLPQEEIALLEEHVRQLITVNDELRQQLAIYKQANDTQRGELLRSHAELLELQKKYQSLQTAHALVSDDESKERARKQIASLINKIDRTIELLDSDI